MKIDQYKRDLETLIDRGDQLHNAIQYECRPDQYMDYLEKEIGDQADEFVQSLPTFEFLYQEWYSEAKVLVNQLLPDRLMDFTRYYEAPKTRKKAKFDDYVIEDYLQGVVVGDRYNRKAWADLAIKCFRQQFLIVKSMRQRFRSSLFEIRQLVQADLFDSELDAAKELANNKFHRAAGVVAGVVLEKHLKEVCANHGVTLRKKAPQISDLNDNLKSANVIDPIQWRSIQVLGDLRNLCAHDKQSEPTREQADDLITGVAKVTKTIF